MKIGIVTLFGDNYGNKLQNLAVQKLIESYGYEAETILVDVKQGIRPVKSRFIKKLAPAHIIKSIKTRFKNKYLYKNDRDGIIKSIYFYKKGDWRELVEKRKKSFSGFKEKYLKISKNKITLTSKSEKWLNEYDFFICGSDQIWNPTYKDVSSTYFLQFVDSGKRIALSPSIGLSKLPKHIKPLYKKWIEEIPYLSVREESGAKIIKDLTGRNAEVLADPTLCVAREEWELIEEKPKFDTDTPYVFAYFLGNEINSYRKYIENFANKKGYKVFNIFDLREPEYYSVNPAEFVYLIHHAEMVFTDSFHASVFSIIMKTPFIVFDRVEVGGKAMSSRIDTLLKTFSFENRKFSLCTENPDLMNFGESEKIISELKNKMDLFLKKAFTSEIKQENKSNCYVLERKEDCSGCTACVSVCPKNCITLNADLEGFSYPVIDSEECINCKLCKNICPSISSTQKLYEPQAYVGYNKDRKVRKNSSSGGLFGALAEQILLQGGWVYGAIFDNQFIVKHEGTNNKYCLAKMLTSKYVQSDVSGIFHIIEEQLERGELVYFSGTPCQVEGLLSYLRKDYESLYTQDIICHGVPSPAVWQAYLNLLKGQKKFVSFRDKKYGWHYFSMHIRTSRGNYLKRLDQDKYIRLFLDNVILRPSCYECHFKKEIRNSDFTLADCWNANSLGVSLKDDDKGLSMIFANSEKGKRFLEIMKDDLVLQKIDYNNAIKSQTAATGSVKKPEQRTVFFEMANINGYQNTIKNWYNKTIIHDVKKTLTYIKTKIKNLIKRGK